MFLRCVALSLSCVLGAAASISSRSGRFRLCARLAVPHPKRGQAQGRHRSQLQTVSNMNVNEVSVNLSAKLACRPVGDYSRMPFQ
jgi:hypothetical protein